MSRKRAAWILGCVGVLGLIGVCALAVRGHRPSEHEHEHESLTTDTDSAQLKTPAERVAFLGRYLKLRTRVTDAAFHIVYHDNSHGLPGPSDWSIVAAVAVTPADGPTWLAGARPLGPNEPASDWQFSSRGRLIPPEWQVSSPGVRYVREGALLVWHSEGVLEFAAQTD